VVLDKYLSKKLISMSIMDIETLLSFAPVILKYGGLLSIFFMIWFYGSLARHGLPKLNFAYRMLFRVVLGVLVYLAAQGLAQFVPLTIEGLPSFLTVSINKGIAGVVLAVAMAISFYIFFKRERTEDRLPGRGLFQGFTGARRIIGGLLILLLVGVTITGIIVEKPEEEGIALPGFGDLFKKEDATCLNVRTVFKSAGEEMFGEEGKQYQSPENLDFLLEKYPGYKHKSASIIENEEVGIYILAILTKEEFEVEGMAGPDEMMSMKLCTVRPFDLKSCDCTGFIGVADVFAGMMKGQMGEVEGDIEGLREEMEGVEGMEDAGIEEMLGAMKELKDIEGME